MLEDLVHLFNSARMEIGVHTTNNIRREAGLEERNYDPSVAERAERLIEHDEMDMDDESGYVDADEDVDVGVDEDEDDEYADTDEADDEDVGGPTGPAAVLKGREIRAAQTRDAYEEL